MANGLMAMLAVARLIVFSASSDADYYASSGSDYYYGSDPACEGVDLFAAVKENLVVKIRRALDCRVNVDAIDGASKMTPLGHATRDGLVEAASLLIKAGADTNIKDKDGFTPMHVAASIGASEIVRKLIKGGAIPSARHPDGYQPIHRACFNNPNGTNGESHTATIKVFLEAGVPVDLIAKNGASCRALLTVNQIDNEPSLELLALYEVLAKNKRDLKYDPAGQWHLSEEGNYLEDEDSQESDEGESSDQADESSGEADESSDEAEE